MGRVVDFYRHQQHNADIQNIARKVGIKNPRVIKLAQQLARNKQRKVVN